MSLAVNDQPKYDQKHSAIEKSDEQIERKANTILRGDLLYSGGLATQRTLGFGSHVRAKPSNFDLTKLCSILISKP